MPPLAKALITAIYPVSDIAAAEGWYAAWARVTKAGAKPLSAVNDVGGGIRVGVVTDPHGNALGLIENPHFAVKG